MEFGNADNGDVVARWTSRYALWSSGAVSMIEASVGIYSICKDVVANTYSKNVVLRSKFAALITVYVILQF